MNVRLIKPNSSRIEEETERPQVEVPIIDTIQSWVHDFRTRRANTALLDLELVNNAGKNLSSQELRRFK